MIDELESHLRDEVERLTRGGLPLDQAWPQAVARLGGPEQLAAEFAKVPPADATAGSCAQSASPWTLCQRKDVRRRSG